MGNGTSGILHSRQRTQLTERPGEFLRIGDHVLACGRDPYFPPWEDVLQLNAFSPELRKATIATVLSIADQCDGMRCDMAMLLLNQVFERTWGQRAGAMPQTEYWRDVIGVVKQRYPDVLFMAEAYWDLEWGLQQQGFRAAATVPCVKRRAGPLTCHLQGRGVVPLHHSSEGRRVTLPVSCGVVLRRTHRNLQEFYTKLLRNPLPR